MPHSRYKKSAKVVHFGKSEGAFPDLESARITTWENPHAVTLPRAKLQSMQQTVQPAPSPSTFAGFLAALAEPDKKPELSWTDDALEDDIATLSYEHALRAHARYCSADATDHSLTQSVDPGRLPARAPSPSAPAVPSQAPPAPRADIGTISGFTPLERNLKCASVTIRLSQAECAQLRQRAAEAGLTVSAYLRSCTFEAETLRALVKDTMAELRSATSAEKQPVSPPVRLSWFQSLVRLLASWHSSPRVARA